MKREDQPGAGEKIVVQVDADLEELIPMFLRNRDRDIATVKEALEREDFAAIQALGHTLKGTGGGYGFHFVTEIGRGLEEAAVEGDGARIRSLAEELGRYLRRVEVVYR